MFGKKTKELEYKVDVLEIKVSALERRLNTHCAHNDVNFAHSRISDLEAKYTALLEKLGLEEVEIKAGIKLVEKQPFGKTCEHGIPIELCSAAHAQEPPP